MDKTYHISFFHVSVNRT